jgi:hypothetical protein
MPLGLQRTALHQSNPQRSSSVSVQTCACRAAQALALQRMLEEDLNWCYHYAMWQRDDGWKLTCPTMFGDMPAPVRAAVTPMVRSGMLKQLHGQVRNAFTWL